MATVMGAIADCGMKNDDNPKSEIRNRQALPTVSITGFFP
jgi:hypothetical protein